MKPYRLASAVAVGVLLSALVASCSGDKSSTAPADSPTSDALVLGGSSLVGGGWTPTVAAAASSSDKVSICHSGNGKHFTAINVSAQGARAHLGDPTTGKGGHEADFRISTATPCPPPTTPGQVQICKVAGPGVPVGTNFIFTLTPDGGQTKTVTVAAGAGPNGTCASGGDFRVGTMVNVTEAAQPGVTTTAIVVTPAGAQQGTSDLNARSATIIVGVGTTTVTFTNQGPTGTLVICKVGGTGVSAGTNFSFSVAGQTQTVAAGAAPNGTCGTALTVGAGTVTVTEAVVAGTVVQSVTGTPTPTNVNLANGSAQILITAGQESRITFTNAAATASNGTLVICKIGGTGVAAGTNFTFTVAGQTQTVAAGAAPNGTCGAPLTIAAGTVAVTETAVAGTSVSAITGTPAAPTNINLAARSASVAITAGQETRVTFTNVAP